MCLSVTILWFFVMEIECNAVGSIVKFNGVRLKVFPAVNGCQGCFFRRKPGCYPELIGSCCPPWRTNNVIFRKYDENKKESFHTYGLSRKNKKSKN